MTLTRDGLSLWLLAVAALAAYLSAAPPPTEWSYQQWIQFVAACAAWAIGKLQASPQPSSKEVKRGWRDDGKDL